MKSYPEELQHRPRPWGRGWGWWRLYCQDCGLANGLHPSRLWLWWRDIGGWNIWGPNEQ